MIRIVFLVENFVTFVMVSLYRSLCKNAAYSAVCKRKISDLILVPVLVSNSSSMYTVQCW